MAAEIKHPRATIAASFLTQQQTDGARGGFDGGVLEGD
jgi:hypothetical protein